MNLQEYEQRKSVLKKEGAHGREFGFNGQKPIDYLKIEVYEQMVTEKAFHWKKKKEKQGNNWVETWEIVDWDKDFIGLIGKLCGVENKEPISERINKYVHLSKSNTTRLMPAGYKAHTSMEYLFDAELRADEVILKNEVKVSEYEAKVKANKKPKYEVFNYYPTEAKKKLKVTEMAKFGAQLANTGAKKRGIIDILRIPKASQELLGQYWFCFQCIPNFDNPSVRDSYLEQSSNPVFGEPEMKKVGQISDEPSLAFKIGEEMSTLKDYKSLDKLTSLMLDKGESLDEYYSFIMRFKSLSKEEKVNEMIDRLTTFEDIPKEVVSGDDAIKFAFLTEWGNK